MNTKIEIPDNWMGKPIKGSLERVLSKSTAVPPIQNETVPLDSGSLPEIVTKNPRNYIQVPQYNGLVIASAETHKGKDMYDTIKFLYDENMKTPSVGKFMRHWLNLREAAQGARTLVYADGTPVTKDAAVDLWNYNSSGHRGGCWTWLDALFNKVGEDWYMQTDLSVSGAGNNRALSGKKVKMDDFLHENAYTTLELNTQGFPKIKALNQKYEQGQNLYFYQPVENCVAGFYAVSDGAGLSCLRDPDSHNDGLGVLACAENLGA